MAAKPKKRVRAGGSAASFALRKKLFVEAYVKNGRNAKEAAIAAGYKPTKATVRGCELLKLPDIAAQVAARAEKVIFDAELSTERWAKEMACIGHFDPRELYDAAGNLIPTQKLPEHVARAIASVEVDNDKFGTRTTKVKLNDKNTALANIGRSLGVFEADNLQKIEPIHVTITLVGKINGPASRASTAGEAAVLDGDAPVQGRLGRP